MPQYKEICIGKIRGSENYNEAKTKVKNKNIRLQGMGQRGSEQIENESKDQINRWLEDKRPEESERVKNEIEE